MMETLRSIFQRPTPQEQMQTWNKELRAQQRILDREILALSQSEQKTRTMLKSIAKKRPDDTKSARVLARELVAAKRQKSRLHQSKATLSSIQMQMKEQFATYKITGTLQKSTEIMKNVNKLIQVPELSSSLQRFGMELAKAGVIEEILSDAFEELEDSQDVGLDAEADAEVDKVLGEVTGGILGKAGSIPLAELEDAEDEEMVQSDKEFLDGMKQKLEMLKS